MAENKKGQPDAGPPVRTPPKMGMQAPESGPSGHTVVDADAPGPGAAQPGDPLDKKQTKEREAAEMKAADSNSAREVKVIATRRGQMGHKIREEGDVFVIQLAAGQTLPSWVDVVHSDDVATTPLSHSSEAQEEVVDSKGIGHTPGSKAETDVK